MFRYKDNSVVYDVSISKVQNPENVVEIFLTDYPTLDGIERFINLERLSCTDSNIKDLTPLKNCKNLTQLLCFYNKIESLLPLRECTKLIKLDCSGNELRSLEGLENCTQLEKLNCGNNQLFSLHGLENCHNLEFLNCDLNTINDFEGLENCNRLITIWACRNPIVNTNDISLINFYYTPEYVGDDVLEEINAINKIGREENFDDSDELESIWWDFE
jgi:Leucine-rich repeat (LRR) protein